MLHRPILTAALLVLLVFGFLTGYVIVTTTPNAKSPSTSRETASSGPKPG